jgi:hypothetical protein
MVPTEEKQIFPLSLHWTELQYTGRWIMSKNVIFVLMYHLHKLLDLINYKIT